MRVCADKDMRGCLLFGLKLMPCRCLFTLLLLQMALGVVRRDLFKDVELLENETKKCNHLLSLVVKFSQYLFLRSPSFSDTYLKIP